MSDFKKALLWTAIPIGALSIISAAEPVLFRGARLVPTFGIIWGAAFVYLVAAFVALIVFIIKRRNRVAAGIIAGIGIGIVAMGASCFANISTLGGL